MDKLRNFSFIKRKREFIAFIRTLRTHWVLFVFLGIVLNGCATTLVEDPVTQITPGEGETLAHCSGSETVDDSSIAVLPVPFAAFFVPHVDLNDIKAEDYLRKCGDASKLKNRKVQVNRTGCIPASLTRIITLGIWQWCPASVSWEADVQQVSTKSSKD